MTLHRSFWFLIGVLVGTYDGAPAQIRSSDPSSTPVVSCRTFVGVSALTPDIQPATDPDTHPDCGAFCLPALPTPFTAVLHARIVRRSIYPQTPDLHPQQPRGQPC